MTDQNKLAVIADKIIPKPTKRQLLEATAHALWTEHAKKVQERGKYIEKLEAARRKAVLKESRKHKRSAPNICCSGWDDKCYVEYKTTFAPTETIKAASEAIKAVPSIRMKSAKDFYDELYQASRSPSQSLFAVEHPEIAKKLLAIGHQILAKADATKSAINV